MHLGAVIIVLPASTLLVWHFGIGGGLLVYAIGLVALFGVSAAYHLGPWSAGTLEVFQRLDYATIYLFIAASMTPYCLLGVPGALSRVVLWTAWLTAGVAVGVIALRFDRWRRRLATGYLVLGWLAIITLPQALGDLSLTELVLFGAMGLIYTAGSIVLAARWPDPFPRTFGYHEVWHAMVVLAASCYYAMVWSMASHPH